MIKVKAYQFKDLDMDLKRSIQQQEINQIIENDLFFLDDDLNSNRITEEQYYKIINCTKHYAETTTWFIPSCYYDKHKASIISRAMRYLKESLFDKNGKICEF